jgi:hypothetical protein
MNEATKVLPSRLSDLIDEFNLSMFDNWIAPSQLIPLAVLSENELNQKELQARSSTVRDEFDLSALATLLAPSSSISFSVFSEYGMKQQVCYW